MDFKSKNSIKKKKHSHTLIWIKQKILNVTVLFFLLKKWMEKNSEGQDNSPSDGEKVLTTVMLAVQKRITTQSLYLQFFCFQALMSNGSPLLDLIEETLWITTRTSLRCADVQLMVSTCSLGVKTLRIFRCSSSWQFPGICCHTTSAWTSINHCEKCFRLGHSRLIIQMHIHRDYSMVVDYGSHIISFAVESEQELYSRLASAVKRVLRHIKGIFDFSLMEHFPSMPSGM